jgi:hypothetical protein
VTRYGDEAYDLRDIPALAELVCSWRRLRLAAALWGAGVLCPECNRDNPQRSKFCGLCGALVI